MIIFIYGQDNYRSGKKLKEIVEGYKKTKKTGLSLSYIDAAKINIQDLQDALSQTSIFKEKKLIVLTSAFSNADFKKDFVKNGKQFVKSDNIFLFYERDKIAKSDSLLKFLNKNARSQEFPVLEGQKLRAWVRKEFEERRGKISEQALEKFIEFIDDDPWKMTNEIQKLSHFANGREIGNSDIELLIKPKIKSDIFKTIEAIASRDKKMALKLLKGHLEKGDSPFYLFSMINYQFRNLLIIKDLISKNLPVFSAGLHPFVARKNSSLAARFSFAELKKIYHVLFEIDLSIKTGKADPESALDLLITGL